MATVGELVIELVVDAKKDTATIKILGDVIEKTTQEAGKNVEKLKGRFQRITEASQRVFYAFQGAKILLSPLKERIDVANRRSRQVVPPVGLPILRPITHFYQIVLGSQGW